MGNPFPEHEEGEWVKLWSVASALGEKPYMCTVPGCGKRFTEYSSLYKHHVVHTHCKPYTCNSCGKTYRQTSTLAMHKRSSHGELEATEESEQALYEEQQLEGEQPLCRHLRQVWVRLCGDGERDDSKSLQPLPSQTQVCAVASCLPHLTPICLTDERKGLPMALVVYHALGMDSCPFCSTGRGEEPSSRANAGLLSS